jgi:hypothetical protein
MAFSNGPKSIVQDGLVFAADAGNAQCFVSGDSTCTDLIEGATGTLIDAAAYNSSGGGSWIFDGTGTDRISFNNPSFLDGVNTFSVCYWAKATYENLNPVFIVSNANDASKAFLIYSYDTNVGTQDARVWYNGASILSTGDTSLTGWNHFCYVQNGATSHIMYINGTSKDTDSTSKTMDSSLDSFDIGGTSNFTQYYDGTATSICVYNKALTQAEIQQNYNATKGRFS